MIFGDLDSWRSQPNIYLCNKNLILGFVPLESCVWPLEHGLSHWTLIVGPCVGILNVDPQLSLKTLIRGCASWNTNQGCLILCAILSWLLTMGLTKTLAHLEETLDHLVMHHQPLKLLLCMRFFHLTYMSTCLGFHMVQGFVITFIHMVFSKSLVLDSWSLFPSILCYQDHQALVINSWIHACISALVFWSLVCLWSIKILKEL